MCDDLVIPECNHRIEVKDETKCQCSNARFSYKGTFDRSFCASCPIANKTAEPTFAEKMARFAIASAKHAANGFKIVDTDEQARRKEICNSCDKFDKENETCKNCGCFVPMKVQWDSERCPLSKW